MIREAIAALADGRDLQPPEAAGAMEEILGGRATPAQIAGFLVALRARGETAEELAAMAMRGRSVRIAPKAPGPLADTCGTGGDRVRAFNMSTSAALVVHGAPGVGESRSRAPPAPWRWRRGGSGASSSTPPTSA